MSESRSIVFLYSELATYFLSCVSALADSYSGAVYVIHWPVNPEAPFKFNFPSNVSFIEKKEVADLQTYVADKNPEVIVSIGWMDKDYVSICKHFNTTVKTVVTMDNQWEGSLKQKIACKVSRWVLRNKFQYIWVPGKPQKIFAEKLGFKKILLNYYCADVAHFDGYYQKQKIEKHKEMPRKFLFVGRYMAHKGIYEMWSAFAKANAKTAEKWELWCLGTGDEYEDKIEAHNLTHFGFVQPAELAEYLEKTAVFVLPSRFEPWGVVVHEYAVAGFPIISTDAVGAASSFVESESNGFVYPAGDEQELEACFDKIINLSQSELIEMAIKSHEIGMRLTPQIWANELKSILD
ncbi:MAG: glycosyltransferase involved in cell wall biosynthesis [Parvicellaceae bacterium]|jgi:glycosyltransferase involved in cell wall biosynthesis